MEYVASKPKREALDYWKTLLKDYVPNNNLNKVNCNQRKFTKYSSEKLVIDKHEFIKLKEFVNHYKITINQFLIISIGILINKLNKVNDCVFGTVVSGRAFPIERIDCMLGNFYQYYTTKSSLRCH